MSLVSLFSKGVLWTEAQQTIEHVSDVRNENHLATHLNGEPAQRLLEGLNDKEAIRDKEDQGK